MLSDGMPDYLSTPGGVDVTPAWAGRQEHDAGAEEEADVHIETTGRALTRDGSRFFYLGDTAWSAFADVTPDEWTYYLDVRTGQGFNAVQFSLLPILHDRSLNPGTDPPFDIGAVESRSHWQFNDRYFSRALEMIDEAASRDVICTLVVLWCSYVPDTWAAQKNPKFVMPRDVLRDYLARCQELMRRPNVILVASGDSAFVSPDEETFYGELIESMKQINPVALVGCHLQPRSLLPAALDKLVDLFVYQSGHNANEQSLGWRLAHYYSSRVPPRPTIDMEPCYEGHAFGGLQRRFTAEDVRRVVWQSLVAGATAGAGYAAHGVWQWHRTGSVFTNPSFSGMPFDWRDALHLPGAGDLALCRRIAETEGLVGATMILNGLDEPTATVSSVDKHTDGLDDVLVGIRQDPPHFGGLAYLTRGRQAVLPLSPDDILDVRGVDLTSKQPVELAVRNDVGGGCTLSSQGFTGDLVVSWNASTRREDTMT
jgi:hypothetical protein